MSRYLTDAQIAEMADAALRSYEVAADWRAAAQAAREYAIDELSTLPNDTAVLLAVKIAKTRWMGITQSVKAQLI